jgi:hypothetical protein
MGTTGLRWTENREKLLNHLWTVDGPHTVVSLRMDPDLGLSEYSVRWDLRRLEVDGLASRVRGSRIRVEDKGMQGEPIRRLKNTPDVWSITEKGKDKAKSCALAKEGAVARQEGA